jgi:hypothetical protein
MNTKTDFDEKDDIYPDGLSLAGIILSVAGLLLSFLFILYAL